MDWAYGYAAERVTCTAEFEPALQHTLAPPGGTLIAVMLDTELLHAERCRLSGTNRAGAA